MNFPSIRIEGAIFSPDILEQIEEQRGQKPANFGLQPGEKVKDEIARAWADAQNCWGMFQRKLTRIKQDKYATTETRNIWIVPLLGLLGYEVEYQSKGTEVNGRNYAISHRIVNQANTCLQIVGYRDDAGLDKKPENAMRRMSAHALVQEYLNLSDQLYGIVSDGHVLRLLRNSSRLVKQTYLEFDLDRIFTDGLYSDFAVMFRLLHASRLPVSEETQTECYLEFYHQNSLESGARIRDGLSKAVEDAITDFGTGFLVHPDNQKIRDKIANKELSAQDFYSHLLRLIYRLLFLMVIEERDLVFTPDAPKEKRDIYYKYYSVQRLRILSEKRYLADERRHDLWLSLLSTFRLFEEEDTGSSLEIAPLAGDLFSPGAIRHFSSCTLSNKVLLGCLRALSVYNHPDTNQLVRVNYAALNVEEFGSVYEGLLEYDPEFYAEGNNLVFGFKKGNVRAATGSHYTPDELVQPLIRHSLDHLIADRLKKTNPEDELLKLKVADIACGSGHILLAAARRIATELATVRTGEEQPSPSAYREALRDVIRNCIYGVDLNPLAVELCKVALWLEAHIPGQPLNFLDHRIKCGNSIVGYVKREDVSKGVPNEAFKTLTTDDKDICKQFRDRNKIEHRDDLQMKFNYSPEVSVHLESLRSKWRELSAMPENTPAQINEKKNRFREFSDSKDAWFLNQIAAIPIAQFYIPKTHENKDRIITDSEFKSYWKGERTPQGVATSYAWEVSMQKRFFHWFLEFPEVMSKGGFDCILGNPPYLGGNKLRKAFGEEFCEYIKWQFAPTGLSELVVFFLRRIFTLLKPRGFTSFITTNSIKGGRNRQDGLKHIIAKGAEINMADRAKKWTGDANVIVSLLAIHKGEWTGLKMLDDNVVPFINSFLENDTEVGDPKKLVENFQIAFIGSMLYGDGFLISHENAKLIKQSNVENAKVILPIINSIDLNSHPNQEPNRSVINFHKWPLDEAMRFEEPFKIVEELVKPTRANNDVRHRREKWWQFGSLASSLYDQLVGLQRCFIAARTTKHLSFTSFPTDVVFTDVIVLATDRWDLFTVVQSSVHDVWMRKFSGENKQDPRYTPSKCFDTFVFPPMLWENENSKLAELGETYHEHRRSIMHSLWLGLTKVYNLFHAKDLTAEMIAKASKQDEDTCRNAYDDFMKLRALHVELDNAVLHAYGWDDVDLEHGFHEVETLPENDRVRFTISYKARREILRRLLAENHARAKEEAALPKPITKSKKRKPKGIDTPDLI